NTSLSYQEGDEITIEYELGTGTVKTTKNGDQSPSTSVGKKAGNIYIGSRGRDGFSVSVKLTDMRIEGPVKYVDDRLTPQVEGLKLKVEQILEQLPIKTYDFQGFDVAEIASQSTATITASYSVTPQ